MGVAAQPWTLSDYIIRNIMDPTGQVLPHELGQGTGSGTVGGQVGQDPYHSLASAVGILEVSALCWACTLTSRCGPDATLFFDAENQPSGATGTRGSFVAANILLYLGK